MGSVNTQYSRCLTEARAEAVVGATVATADPTLETQGVVAVNKEFATIRMEETFGGTYDVRLWRLFSMGQGESWVLDAGFGTVSMNGGAVATARKFVTVQLNGCVRLYAQVLNFGAGGTATVRICAGG